MIGARPMMVITAILFVLMILSALMLVYSKHQSRKLFVEVQQLKYQIDELDTEWARLQLEQSAWSEHGRIEQIARSRLSMVMPETDEVVFIEP